MKINIFVQSFFHRPLTFYNLIYNKALLTPSTHQKNFMQNVGGRKKISCKHIHLVPQEKKFMAN